MGPQVNYINKALQRFDARIVIPLQFLSFSLAAIIGSFSFILPPNHLIFSPGSAIVWREFDSVPFSSFLNFVFGFSLEIAGVFYLTQSPASAQAQTTYSTPKPSYLPLPDSENLLPPFTFPSNGNPSPKVRRLNSQAMMKSPVRGRTVSGVTLGSVTGGANYLFAGSSPSSLGMWTGEEVEDDEMEEEDDLEEVVVDGEEGRKIGQGS